MKGVADMAAMKPRTGDGPMEAVKEGRLIIVRVPLEGGGRLVVSVNDAEAKELVKIKLEKAEDKIRKLDELISDASDKIREEFDLGND